ncbi:hypothetical protein CK203_041235 [Vitis vinifera]|uniref:Uncharacterized protein n=1 Tax=Vitis vinifera TaxID=29760 RepID=A0A438HJ69_VITVI|nr:hypothetical protein CK203_041235 [Vitis vinifera]
MFNLLFHLFSIVLNTSNSTFLSLFTYWLQGHMYLFVRYICFYSNIFGFETKCWDLTAMGIHCIEFKFFDNVSLPYCILISCSVLLFFRFGSISLHLSYLVMKLSSSLMMGGCDIAMESKQFQNSRCFIHFTAYLW